MRNRVKPGAGASVTAGCSSASETLHHLPPGTVVVCAEDRGDRVRIGSPAGWLNAADLEPTEPVPSLILDYDVFKD